MPLRDHFRPPLDSYTSWEGFHGQWPGVIVQRLNAKLPAEFVAEPRVHLGSAAPENGGVATAVWAPAEPAILLDAEIPTSSEYEVLIFDVSRQRRLVAAIEIVSPGNKDRVENCRAFASKCHALLLQDVCVVIVDLVTIRSANLYRDLAERIGARAPAAVHGPIYAVACRTVRARDRWRVEAWEHELILGQPLPTLPLWLTDQMFVPLELEASYEDACRALRIR